MKLGDKIRYLREVEGQLRGLGRAMTQGELVRAMREEMGAAGGANGANGSLSQSYLSQIESGARPHLTNTTRLLLARFFKVHPGYLVEDPEGYQDELVSDLRSQVTLDEKLDLWLIGGAERFRRDAELRRALLAIARHEDSRRCLLLLESILETPSLGERLLELLRPEETAAAAPTARKTPLLVAAEPLQSAGRVNGARKSSKDARGNAPHGNAPHGNGSHGNGAKSSQQRRGGGKR
jgi:transcriptional regulator with XRE-family HTH domain